jgi:hypothetical protein
MSCERVGSTVSAAHLVTGNVGKPAVDALAAAIVSPTARPTFKVL